MQPATTLRTLTICVALALSAILVGTATAAEGLSSRTAAPAPGVEVPVRFIAAADTCSLINFEGIPDVSPVGIFVGPVMVTFGTSWLGVVDADNGGSGNFANEPSPNTIAFFFDTNDISISLSPGVRFVRFKYVASAISLPIVVTAYDAGGNVVATQAGSTVGNSSDGAQCTGDPSGNFCLWDQITLVSALNIISSITITGTVANQFGIDDVFFCVEASPTPTRHWSWGSLKMRYR